MTPEEQASGRWTILVRLIRPQGRHGEILADILTDFPQRFADRRQLSLLSSETAAAPVRDVILENHWLHKGRIVLKFAGIDSINDADRLRGLFVAIPGSERTELNDGSFYIADLIGCQLIDISGAPVIVGTVADVDREAALLIVRTPGSGEALIPFAAAYLAKIDTAAKRIEMRLPAGLLDINAPLTEEERRALDASSDNQ
jgi:16S rRNA processing protein RimM